jgi:hypothetical protein
VLNFRKRNIEQLRRNAKFRTMGERDLPPGAAFSRVANTGRQNPITGSSGTMPIP